MGVSPTIQEEIKEKIKEMGDIIEMAPGRFSTNEINLFIIIKLLTKRVDEIDNNSNKGPLVSIFGQKEKS